MPQIIQHIDKIAREKGRGVLFVTFHESGENNDIANELADVMSSFDYEKCTAREQLINWLEENQIDYLKCSRMASPNAIFSYKGQIYLDVCYDIEDPVYLKVSSYLEFPDGSPRISGVSFYYLPLEWAIKNQRYDKTEWF